MCMWHHAPSLHFNVQPDVKPLLAGQRELKKVSDAGAFFSRVWGGTQMRQTPCRESPRCKCCYSPSMDKVGHGQTLPIAETFLLTQAQSGSGRSGHSNAALQQLCQVEPTVGVGTPC
ncbi:hypothetical protein GOODEAATRI_014287 [Goodea atripinnis]|uniref:Uncharacterized protein n=1 Tax=Goodea atripinnis TaxID=208336 RepID=A0ABV0N1L9_9TELE